MLLEQEVFFLAFSFLHKLPISCRMASNATVLIPVRKGEEVFTRQSDASGRK